jgi:ribonuclease D
MSSTSSSSGRPTDFRRRHRQAHHESAHADDASFQAVPDHLSGVPRGKALLIERDAQLAGMLDAIRAAGVFAFDTEFIGESSYRPQLCVLQVATSDTIWLVDPIAGVDCMPIFELICDPSIAKTVHAGEQDLEQVHRATGKLPANVLDTQIVSGFAALGYPVALAKLALELAGVMMHKGFTFTDWTQRPLSASQLRYAADDVRYLPMLRRELDATLDSLGRSAWARRECDERIARLAETSRAEHQWKRVRGANTLDGRGVNILKRLVSWRDASARTADLPVRTFLKDEVLIDLSRKPPSAIDRMSNIKHLPRPVIEQHGRAILDAIQQGKADPIDRLDDETPEPRLSEKFRIDTIWSALQLHCQQAGIDPALVTSRQEVGDFVRQTDPARRDEHRLLQGWRREAAGLKLVELVRP